MRWRFRSRLKSSQHLAAARIHNPGGRFQASCCIRAFGQKRKLTSDRLLSLIRPLYYETCRWGNSHNSANPDLDREANLRRQCAANLPVNRRSNRMSAFLVYESEQVTQSAKSLCIYEYPGKAGCNRSNFDIERLLAPKALSRWP